MKTAVLITCGGGLQGYTLIKELRELANVSIHVINNQEESIGKYFADSYVVAPPISKIKKYESFLRKYVSHHSIRCLIPATPYDLRLLATLKKEFKSSFDCSIAVSDSELLSVFLNKSRTYEWLKVHKLKTFELINPIALGDNLPVIGRKNDAWGGKDSVVISRSSQLDEIQNTQDFAWTSYLDDFTEYSIDFCINFERKISREIVRERLSTLTGFAVIMEASQLPKSIEEAVQGLIQIIEKKGGCGLFNIQIIEDANGDVYISDINPRVGTSSVMGPHIGLNLCAHLLGCDRSFVPSLPRVKVIRHMEETVIQQINLKQIKGIVFDLDDTLIPQKPWILSKVKQVAGCYFEKNQDEFLEAASMLIDEGKAFCLYDYLCEMFDAEELRESLIELHRKFLPDSIAAYPDVESSLIGLGGRYTLGILTDNPLKSQKQKLKRFQYSSYFDHVVFTDELGQKKPGIGAFRTMAEAMDLAPSELVMVGDNYHRDIKGAQGAGFGHTFFIQRRESMFNTGPNKMDWKKETEISGLHELSWYL